MATALRKWEIRRMFERARPGARVINPAFALGRGERPLAAWLPGSGPGGLAYEVHWHTDGTPAGWLVYDGALVGEGHVGTPPARVRR